MRLIGGKAFIKAEITLGKTKATENWFVRRAGAEAKKDVISYSARAYYTFTTEMNPFFLLSLTGLGLTVYGVIIPTEIRDYFGDKATGIETMTVRLGLVKASLSGIVLLTTGAILTGTAFLLEWTYRQHAWLSVFLLAIPIAVIFVLGKFKRLYYLSKEHTSSKSQTSVSEDLVSLSAKNPQWIMLVTQTYSAMSIILLLSKFLL